MQYVGVLEHCKVYPVVRLTQAAHADEAKAKLIASFIAEFGEAEEEDEQGRYGLGQPNGYLTVYQIRISPDDGTTHTVPVWSSEGEYGIGGTAYVE